MRCDVRELDRAEWAAYLLEHSGLPGPRANLALAQAVADAGDAADFDALIETGEEYLVLCGVIGLGALLAKAPGHQLEQRLRRHAADERWRVREAVAMALQRLGDADLPRLFTLAADWAADEDPLVQRAAVAGVCEPRLLTQSAGEQAVRICERVTTSLAARPADQRRSDEVRALRKALGYCWSVAVAADPDRGLPLFNRLSNSGDADIAWIVGQNRKKARLAKLLSGRVEAG